MKTRTQWFSCEEAPIRHGKYEFRGVKACFPNTRCDVHVARFNGEDWRNMRGFVLDGIGCCPDRYEWRGLAEKP